MEPDLESFPLLHPAQIPLIATAWLIKAQDEIAGLVDTSDAPADSLLHYARQQTALVAAELSRRDAAAHLASMFMPHDPALGAGYGLGLPFAAPSPLEAVAAAWGSSVAGAASLPAGFAGGAYLATPAPDVEVPAVQPFGAAPMLASVASSVPPSSAAGAVTASAGASQLPGRPPIPRAGSASSVVSAGGVAAGRRATTPASGGVAGDTDGGGGSSAASTGIVGMYAAVSSSRRAHPLSAGASSAGGAQRAPRGGSAGAAGAAASAVPRAWLRPSEEDIAADRGGGAATAATAAAAGTSTSRSLSPSWLSGSGTATSGDGGADPPRPPLRTSTSFGGAAVRESRDTSDGSDVRRPTSHESSVPKPPVAVAGLHSIPTTPGRRGGIGDAHSAPASPGGASLSASARTSSAASTVGTSSSREATSATSAAVSAAWGKEYVVAAADVGGTGGSRRKKRTWEQNPSDFSKKAAQKEAAAAAAKRAADEEAKRRHRQELMERERDRREKTSGSVKPTPPSAASTAASASAPASAARAVATPKSAAASVAAPAVGSERGDSNASAIAGIAVGDMHAGLSTPATLGVPSLPAARGRSSGATSSTLTAGETASSHLDNPHDATFMKAAPTEPSAMASLNAVQSLDAVSSNQTPHVAVAAPFVNGLGANDGAHPIIADGTSTAIDAPLAAAAARPSSAHQVGATAKEASSRQRLSSPAAAATSRPDAMLMDSNSSSSFDAADRHAITPSGAAAAKVGSVVSPSIAPSAVIPPLAATAESLTSGAPRSAAEVSFGSGGAATHGSAAVAAIAGDSVEAPRSDASSSVPVHAPSASLSTIGRASPQAAAARLSPSAAAPDGAGTPTRSRSHAATCPSAAATEAVALGQAGQRSALVVAGAPVGSVSATAAGSRCSSPPAFGAPASSAPSAAVAERRASPAAMTAHSAPLASQHSAGNVLRSTTTSARRSLSGSPSASADFPPLDRSAHCTPAGDMHGISVAGIGYAGRVSGSASSRSSTPSPLPASGGVAAARGGHSRQATAGAQPPAPERSPATSQPAATRPAPFSSSTRALEAYVASHASGGDTFQHRVDHNGEELAAASGRVIRAMPAGVEAWKMVQSLHDAASAPSASTRTVAVAAAGSSTSQAAASNGLESLNPAEVVAAADTVSSAEGAAATLPSGTGVSVAVPGAVVEAAVPPQGGATQHGIVSASAASTAAVTADAESGGCTAATVVVAASVAPAGALVEPAAATASHRATASPGASVSAGATSRPASADDDDGRQTHVLAHDPLRMQQVAAAYLQQFPEFRYIFTGCLPSSKAPTFAGGGLAASRARSNAASDAALAPEVVAEKLLVDMRAFLSEQASIDAGSAALDDDEDSSDDDDGDSSSDGSGDDRARGGAAAATAAAEPKLRRKGGEDYDPTYTPPPLPPRGAVVVPPHERRYIRIASSHKEVTYIVRRALALDPRWQEVPAHFGNAPVWNLMWSWGKPPIYRNLLLTFQKVNHFKHARELTRKDMIKKNLARYQCLGPKMAAAFSLQPTTFVMPKEYLQFAEAFGKAAAANAAGGGLPSFMGGADGAAAEAVSKLVSVLGIGSEFGLAGGAGAAAKPKEPNIWIMKPAGLSRGRGISLVSDMSQVKYAEDMIIQRYIHNPLLLDGYKFDLRLYVLVTSFAPLEAFLYRRGFARLSSSKFTADIMQLDNKFIHLTNSSIQKHSGTAKSTIAGLSGADEALVGGTKCSLEYLWKRLRERGIDVDKLWENIVDLVVKSLVCVDDVIPNQPNSFEVYGYDVMIDDNLKPWLVEVNASPSLGVDSDMDVATKTQLIADTLGLVDPLPFSRGELCDVLERRLHAHKAARTSAAATAAFGGLPAAASGGSKLAPAGASSTADRAALVSDIARILYGRTVRGVGDQPPALGHYQQICPGTLPFVRTMKLKLLHFKKGTGAAKGAA